VTSAADDKPAGFTLRRWSQRKLAAAREATDAPPVLAAPVPPVAAVPALAPASASEAVPAPAADALPPVESLRFDSDFSVFMQPKVEESLKRQALRRLFQDPHFNVMDGLDTYIDDYSISDPIPPEMLAQLRHTRYLFDPPKTRVNAEGHVEDVPPEEVNPTTEPAADEPPAVLAVADAPPVDAAPDIAPAQPDTEPAPIARPDDEGTNVR
jgi:hypothetical protein